jgi:pilus assembly protein CpaE
MAKIRVLIVDDLPDTREHVRTLLGFEPDIEVVGQAGTGNQAVELAKQQRPDIILMDINMPGGDGIAASQAISKAVPNSQIVIMSVQSEADYLRRAMLAGARDFLMKPFSGDELVTAVRRVHESRPVGTTAMPQPQPAVSPAPAGRRVLVTAEGKLVVVFSPKGGSGCTTVAVNVATSLAQSGHRTILVDASLQFGDVAVMLNSKPVTSIIDLIERVGELEPDLIRSVVQSHPSGLQILLAPPRPEMAELVGEKQMRAILKSLRQMYDFVVVDTSANLSEVILSIMDEADRIVVLAHQSLPSLKNVSRFFDLTRELSYEPRKTMLVINRGSPKQTISYKDVGDTLKRPVALVIPLDEVANEAADQGRPLVSGQWQKRQIAVALNKLAEQIVDELRAESNGQAEQPAATSRLSRLFGNR